MDDATPITSHGDLVAFVPADPSPDVDGTDDRVLDDPRTAYRTQGILYDRVRNVALQRLLPGPYPERRDTLSQVGDALGNLRAVCCSGELGRYVISTRLSSYLTDHVRRSHETTPSLPPPTPPSFLLDFAQVLQATTASPAKGRRRVALGSGVTRDTMAGAGADHRSTSDGWSPMRRRPERISEEEGWEVVEDNGGDDGLG